MGIYVTGYTALLPCPLIPLKHYLQLGASPSVMFGEDIPWYAKGITNQLSREKDGRERHRRLLGKGVSNQPTYFVSNFGFVSCFFIIRQMGKHIS